MWVWGGGCECGCGEVEWVWGGRCGCDVGGPVNLVLCLYVSSPVLSSIMLLHSQTYLYTACDELL